jgi:hypothetical protein
LQNGFLNGVENWQTFDKFTGLAGSYATDHFGAVFLATFCMKRTCFSSDALTNDSRIAIYKNTHVWIGSNV